MTKQEAKKILEERFMFALEHYKEECGDYVQALENGAIALETVDKLQSELDQWKRESISDKAKLGEYKILEVQGLLIKLPCKVGDTIYDTDFKRLVPCMVTGFSYGVLLDDEDDDYADEVVLYCKGSGIEQSFGISEIGKTVFLTKEEAKKKLEGGVSNE